MYLLNNKNYLCKKIIRRKKQLAKHELTFFKCIFWKRKEILWVLFTKNTVKPVEDDHSWDHSKVVMLDRWSSYKTRKNKQ